MCVRVITVVCLLLPALDELLAYWWKKLIKKQVSGSDWVSQFNTVSIQPACADEPKHTHRHALQSLFKRQTRAVLLS